MKFSKMLSKTLSLRELKSLGLPALFVFVPIVGVIGLSIFQAVTGRSVLRRPARLSAGVNQDGLERNDLYVDPGFDRNMADRRRFEERRRIAEHRNK
jgi:hypothetical protein